MPNFNMNIQKLNPHAVLPAQGTPASAGFDLCACIQTPVTIYPGETVMIPTGLAMEIPVGVAGLIYARSGMAANRGLAPANKVAVIDPDYRGEIFVTLLNHGKIQQTVQPGDRIAQMLFTPYLTPAFTVVEDLSRTERGEGRFGSTGTAALPEQKLAAPVAPPAPPAPVAPPAPPVQEPQEVDPADYRDDSERSADEAFALGMRYKQGDGVEQSDEKALEQFKRAAEFGHIHAQLLVGSYYYGKNQCEEAAKWLQMAADLGNSDALFQLGVFYIEGDGVEQDLEKAAKYFHRAARRQHADARYAYADCCSQGIGVEKDEAKALKWFEAAAEQHHVDAMYRLGQCYEQGLGTKKDLAKARRWYEDASKGGNRMATQALVMLQLSEMGEMPESMTPPAQN